MGGLILKCTFLSFSEDNRSHLELLSYLPHNDPQHNEVVGGGGVLASLRPSVRPSVRPSSRIWCPLCSAHSSGWIHFIFMHLIKQHQKVCHIQSSFKMSRFEILVFFLICNFDFVLFWLGIWCESLVRVIMGRQEVSQNAGVLVVLVYHHSEVTSSLTHWDWDKWHFADGIFKWILLIENIWILIKIWSLIWPVQFTISQLWLK